MVFKEIIFLVVLVAAVNAEYVSYKDYKVYKIVPKDEHELQVLTDLRKQPEYIYWNDIVSLYSDVKIMVAPEYQQDFETYFKTVNITAEVVFNDVQKLIDDQLKRPVSRSVVYDWSYFLNLDEINAWLTKIVEEHSDVATLVELGTSVEGRTIWGVKIDYKKEENPVIGMIEGGIHSREWISPATVTYIINEFLTSTDESVRFMAENIVWHIFPVVNPDGYYYTFNNNRMWRKNRSKDNFQTCTSVADDISNGIDLNRNFDFMWMHVGASQNPCMETYAGPNAFSEPESRAIAGYVQHIKKQGRMIYYFAFHSYSQMVLVPYSHLSGDRVLEAPNYADMYEIAIRGMDKLKAKHNTNYQVGTSGDILYYVSGSSFDWVKGAEGIPIVYLFELRDVGEYGFLLPAERIIPNNEEIMAGLLEMERVTRSMGYYNIQNDLLFPPTTQPPTDTTEATEPSTTAAPGSGMKTVFSVFLIALSLFVTL
ncbi:zinc carboxypeptidase-like isoform X2 [Spodoptera frugiperda]|uniref:Zinc carboxypeptidase A 1 n=1 Tax=Spodoptera frugiperda TaxID=7108 RepID=A0A9R0DEB8_SPOFR|nr:zinc carboxypeptidase-like isoform X2 [Spodoptera frugiperda]